MTFNTFYGKITLINENFTQSANMVKPNISKIAEMADVSTATVSRVMNNTGPVRKDTRQKIIRIVRELSYVPVTGENGNKTATKNICLLMPYLINDLCTHIDYESSIRKCNLVFSTYHDDEKILRNVIQSMMAVPVDGFIIIAPQEEINFKEIISEIYLPVIMVNTADESCSNVSFNIDNPQGVSAAVDHLVKHHGFAKIAMIKGPWKNKDADERFLGFKDSLERNGILFKPEYFVDGDFSYLSGFYGLSRLLSLAERPEAVFVANDMMAIGAYDAAKNWNLEVGKDIAIIGFDDIEISRIIKPSLTTVCSHFSELGVKALNYLSGLIDGEIDRNKLHHEKISSALIIRESCGCKSGRMIH